MRRKQNRIALYRTETRAKRYAADLKKAWPMYRFEPRQHPRDFGWTVALLYTEHHSIHAYVLQRPKGPITQLGYTGH